MKDSIPDGRHKPQWKGEAASAFWGGDVNGGLVAKKVSHKVLKARANKQPRVINVDKNAAYPPAIEELKEEKVLEKKSKLRQVKY